MPNILASNTPTKIDETVALNIPNFSALGPGSNKCGRVGDGPGDAIITSLLDFCVGDHDFSHCSKFILGTRQAADFRHARIAQFPRNTAGLGN
jgi:hypothetical protein